jgi:hypothetical protein
MWSLPRFIRAPDAGRGDSASFFAFGVFSGVASSCCAPVLAGVMTLSALSGSPAGGALLGLAYVFGVVFPLLVMALAWDRLHLASRRIGQSRPVRLRLAGRTLVTSTVGIAVAAGFAVMGGFVIYLASAGRMTSGPSFQVATGRSLAALFRHVEDWARPAPEPVLGLALLALAAVFIVATLRDRRHPGSGEPETPRTRTRPAATWAAPLATMPVKTAAGLAAVHPGVWRRVLRRRRHPHSSSDLRGASGPGSHALGRRELRGVARYQKGPNDSGRRVLARRSVS